MPSGAPILDEKHSVSLSKEAFKRRFLDGWTLELAQKWC